MTSFGIKVRNQILNQAKDPADKKILSRVGNLVDRDVRGDVRREIWDRVVNEVKDPVWNFLSETVYDQGK